MMRRPAPLRPSAGPSFETVEASLAALWTDLQPDPLFVRRLRGETVNRYVAVRESGRAAAVSDRIEHASLGRLGRACLYASFVFAATAASVLAASQDALPGDALYTLKVRMEQVRLDVLPAHLHDDLYAYTLSQRIDEMGRLTEAGHWQLAQAMTPVIEDSYEQFAHALDEQGLASEDASRHLIVLQGLLEQLPERARAAVQAVIDRAAETGPAGEHPGAAPAAETHSAPGQADQPASGGGAGNDPMPPGQDPQAADPSPRGTGKPEPKLPRESRPSHAGPDDLDGLGGDDNSD